MDLPTPATVPPAAKEPALYILLIPIVLAYILMTDGVVSRPGGPIISVHAELMPMLLCMFVIYWAWPSLRRGRWWRQIAVAFIILLYATLASLIITVIIETWIWIWPRASFWGW